MSKISFFPQTSHIWPTGFDIRPLSYQDIVRKTIPIPKLPLSLSGETPSLKDRSITRNPHVNWRPWLRWVVGAAGFVSLGWMILRENKDALDQRVDWKSWGKWVAGTAGFLILGGLVYREYRGDLEATDTSWETDPLLETEGSDPKEISELKEFVRVLNTSETSSSQRKELLKQAFGRIDHLKYVGLLSPRKTLTPDVPLARKGLLILTLCQDSAVRRQAFKYLKNLLKQEIDPEEPLKELIFLERSLGNRLKGLSEVNDPIPALQESVSCYSLLLERIFFSSLLNGGKVSNQDRLDTAQRAAEIGRKLEQNPAFQYEALNAKTLAANFQTPSQPVTQSLTALYEITQVYLEAKGDVQALALEGFSLKTGLQKLKDFLLVKNPDNFRRVEQAFKRLESAWKDTEASTAALESILVLKPSWQSELTPVTDLKSLQEIIEKSTEWEPLYRVTMVLSDILLSSAQENLKKEALHQLITLIRQDTPWQVRYKVATLLLSLKRDPLFHDLAEEGWQKHMSISMLDSQGNRALHWFERVEKSQAKIDRNISELSSFKPSGKLEEQIESSWVLKRGFFVPRDEALETIARQFHESSIQIISGPKGTGKTTLAACYAKRYGRDYSLVHWISSKTLLQDLEDLADQVGISKDLKPSERLDLLKSWLSEEKNTGWLIVVDNVEPEECENLKKYLPKEGRHLLLTTYRRPQVESLFTSPSIVTVKPFSPVEAIYFLTQNRQAASKDKETAQKIAETLGYLPLALVQARAYIERTNCSFDDFLEIYDREKIKTFGERAASLGKDENPSVVVLWDMAYKKAKEENPVVENLMGFLAYLHPEVISVWLIELWARQSDLRFNEERVRDALNILTDYALLERSGALLSIHSLLQEIAKHHLVEKQEEYFEKTLKFLSEVPENIPDSESLDQWSRETTLVPHLEAIVEKANFDRNLFEIASIYPRIGSYYENVQVNLEKARKNFELALASQRKIHNTDEHPSVADSLNNLAGVLQAQGDLEGAKAMHSQVLEIRRKIYKTDEHPSVAGSLNNLAGILYDQGDLNGAKAMYSQALEIKRKIYKTDEHPSVASSLNNLAVVLKAHGDLESAKAMCSQALEIQRKIYKTDEHPDVVVSLNTLAGILQDQGDLNGAKAMYSQALEIKRNIYKTDEHPDVAGSLNNLALALKAQGDLEGAKALHFQTLDIRRKIYKTDMHPDVADSLNNLGIVLMAQWDLESAKAMHSQALKIKRKIYKTDEHPSVAESFNNLAGILYDQGDLESAKAMDSQALEIKRKIYKTDEHPDVASSLNNLAVVLKAQGDLESAKAMCSQALDIRRKIYKTDMHPEVADSLDNLAVVLKAQGDLESAKALHSQALDIRRKIYKTDMHPDVADSLNNLAGILQAQGDLEGAKIMYSQALEIRRKIYKTDEHPIVVTCRNNLAEVLKTQGDYEPSSAK